MEQYYATVDIGGTNVRVAIVGREGFLIKVTSPVQKEGENTAVPRQVLRLLDYACHELNITSKAVEAMGISTCSPFKKINGHSAIIATNLCGGLAREGPNKPNNNWTYIPLEAVIKPNVKHLEYGNDCITAVVAEWMFGAGKGEDDLLYVTWSTGIGAGAYVDGHLIKGKNGNGVHLGHTFIAENRPDVPVCNEQDVGHLEALVAGPAIARDYNNIKAALGGSDMRYKAEPYTTKDVFDKYREGEEDAIKIIERAAENMARGLSSAVAMYDTKVIIMGGSVWKDKDILRPLVEKYFYNTFKAMTEGVEIRDSGLGNYLGEMAALSLVMPKLWIPDWEEREPWKNAPEAIKLK